MSRPEMTKAEMAQGFALGRTLIQEEWSSKREIADVDELIAAGAAELTSDWKYLDEFQCERRVVRGVPEAGK